MTSYVLRTPGTPAWTWYPERSRANDLKVKAVNIPGLVGCVCHTCVCVTHVCVYTAVHTLLNLVDSTCTLAQPWAQRGVRALQYLYILNLVYTKFSS
jgi:hypothetical protein